LTPSRPDAVPLRSDRRPGLPLRKGLPGQHPAVPVRSPVPLRRKRPAGTRGSGDIDKPSAVTGRACSIGDHAASEIDAPGPCLTPTCGGRTRRPRTEEWPLPDDHLRSRCQLGALDPRSPITEEDMNQVLGAIVFATGAASGWVVWYLKEIKRYGDFFYVLLLTITIGLCWYARLTAPEPVQITAVAFVLGSLFRIARDYMDAAVSVGEERASAGSEDGGLAKAPSPTQVRTQSANSPRRRGDRSKGAHP
jgi:hypothetical protein